jgi:hypothetical protein
LPSPAESSKTDRLKYMVRPLRPERAPFYVQHATAECPMIGWYWQPAGEDAPVALGASYEAAILRLAGMLT